MTTCWPGAIVPKKNTLPKTNMDTQNDGLEKVTPLKKVILVSMLVFGSVTLGDLKVSKTPKGVLIGHFWSTQA